MNYCFVNIEQIEKRAKMMTQVKIEQLVSKNTHKILLTCFKNLFYFYDYINTGLVY